MPLKRLSLTTLVLLGAAAIGAADDGKPDGKTDGAAGGTPNAGDSAAKNTSGVAIPKTPALDAADATGRLTPGTRGKAIAEFADVYDRGWRDEVTRGRMTLFDAGGDSVERTFSRMAYERAEKGDKLIIRFLSPAEIKGVSALTYENPGSSDDNWLYLPANKRVRRVSGANNTASFQGTEFTYEDLGTLDPVEYEWRFVAEMDLKRGGKSIPVYKLDARPKYTDTGYSRLVVYYDKTAFRQQRIEYYDKAGKHLKTRDSSGWKLLHGRFWRAFQIDMVNHQTGKRTSLAQERYFLNLSLYTSSKTGKPRKNLPETLFTTQALQK